MEHSWPGIPRELNTLQTATSLASPQVLRKLDHPHIVRLFEWFEAARSVLDHNVSKSPSGFKHCCFSARLRHPSLSFSMEFEFQVSLDSMFNRAPSVVCSSGPP